MMPNTHPTTDRRSGDRDRRTPVRVRVIGGAVTGSVIAATVWVVMGLPFSSLVFHLQQR